MISNTNKTDSIYTRVAGSDLKPVVGETKRFEALNQLIRQMIHVPLIRWRPLLVRTV